MRTYIKEQDPGTAVTLHLIRKLVLQGKIPYIKAGNRFLLDIDSLFTYLSGVLVEVKHLQEEQFERKVIRPISEKINYRGRNMK